MTRWFRTKRSRECLGWALLSLALPIEFVVLFGWIGLAISTAVIAFICALLWVTRHFTAWIQAGDDT